MLGKHFTRLILVITQSWKVSEKQASCDGGCQALGQPTLLANPHRAKGTKETGERWRELSCPFKESASSAKTSPGNYPG